MEGQDNHRAYVGPEELYDLVGAMQFNLLCNLGLREGHRLLDFGCGSLRAGRLFIQYLNEGRYYGVEPNGWLVDAAVEKEIGSDILLIKKPNFLYSDEIKFDRKFDYIIAHSIFTHCGLDLIGKILVQFKDHLKSDGLCIVTFFESRGHDDDHKGWKYPGTTFYKSSTIVRTLEDSGFYVGRYDHPHPRKQKFYLLSLMENLVKLWTN